MEKEREIKEEQKTVEDEHQTAEEKPAATEEPVDQPAEEAEEAKPESDLSLEDLRERVVELEEELEELEQEAAKNLDGWQRAQASFQNYRRRAEAEKKEWRITANAALLARVLPILDDFDRAFKNIPDALEGHKWLDGVRLVKQKLHHLLKTENVEPIEVEPGDEFDPNYHEAVLSQPVEGFEEGQIVAEAQRGYMQGERVLRPTRVVVAAAMPEADADESQEDETLPEEESASEE